MSVTASATGYSEGRVPWVDTAKGICIMMVVMMHSTLGVEAAAGATGWLGQVVEFSRPFRMPDFFLVSGLFLSARIGADWRLYLDRKVLHFVYFYVLWMVIQCFFKCVIVFGLGPFGFIEHIVESLVQPFGTLWFIYLLAIFFVVAKLVRGLPPLAIWLVAAGLEMAPIHTGWIVADEFAARFVYFYTGYIMAPYIFALANAAGRRRLLAVGGLAVWALVNGLAVAGGISTLPGVGLFLGFAGAVAITVIASTITDTVFGRSFAFAGAHSIAIYLAFFLPMAAMRTMLVKLGIIADVGTMSAIVTVFATVTPLIALAVADRTFLKFLFNRPAWARLVPAGSPRKAQAPQAALTAAE
ncbi:MAG: acyltransferase family protein [Rhodobiaceae bacterium]|nr:acyltransferase family protein [Rhodobiaceae bacterium]